MTLKNSISSAELVELIKDKNLLAIDYLRNKYENLFRTMVSVIVPHGNQYLILDEIYHTMYLKIGEYDSNQGTLFIWLSNVARKLCLSKVIGVNRLPYIDRNGCSKLFERNLGKRVFWLVFYEGYNCVEIATIYNLSVDTIKRWLQEYITELRKIEYNDLKPTK